MVHDAIKSVLSKNNRVIIPEVGAIIIGEESSNKLFFSEHIKFDDEIILDELMEEYAMPRDEAEACIQDFIKEVKKELDIYKCFQIEGLGFIQVDTHNKIVFNTDKVDYEPTGVTFDSHDDDQQDDDTPLEVASIETENSSLNAGFDEFSNLETEGVNHEVNGEDESFDLPDQSPIENEEIDSFKPEVLNNIEDEPSSFEAAEDYESAYYDDEGLESPNPQEEKKSWVGGAIMACFMLLISAVAGWYFFIREKPNTTAHTAHTTTAHNETPAELVAINTPYEESDDNAEDNESDALPSDNNAEESADLEESDTPENQVEALGGASEPENTNTPKAENERSVDLPSKNSTDAIQPKGFSVVVGSFAVVSNAQALADKLLQQGYDVNVITASDDRYLVGFTGLNNRQSAEEMLIKAKEIDGDAWIKQGN